MPLALRYCESISPLSLRRIVRVPRPESRGRPLPSPGPSPLPAASLASRHGGMAPSTGTYAMGANETDVLPRLVERISLPPSGVLFPDRCMDSARARDEPTPRSALCSYETSREEPAERTEWSLSSSGGESRAPAASSTAATEGAEANASVRGGLCALWGLVGVPRSCARMSSWRALFLCRRCRGAACPSSEPSESYMSMSSAYWFGISPPARGESSGTSAAGNGSGDSGATTLNVARGAWSRAPLPP